MANVSEIPETVIKRVFSWKDLQMKFPVRYDWQQKSTRHSMKNITSPCFLTFPLRPMFLIMFIRIKFFFLVSFKIKNFNFHLFHNKLQYNKLKQKQVGQGK